MKQIAGNEVPLCIRGKTARASLTLEAAVVLPFLAFFFVVILFWFRVLEVETEVYVALNYASRKTAAACALAENETAELALAEGLFWTRLSQADHAGTYLSTAQKVLMLAQSDTEGDYVELVADYRIKLPVTFFSVKNIHISQKSRSRKWTGNKSDDTDEEYVYVTARGSVYHLTKECRYLDLSIREENLATVGALRNLDGHKYYACEQCVAENLQIGTVYVTDYGTTYHDSLTCSGLKRSISVVRKSEVQNKKVCSKCEKNSKQSKK